MLWDGVRFHWYASEKCCAGEVGMERKGSSLPRGGVGGLRHAPPRPRRRRLTLHSTTRTPRQGLGDPEVSWHGEGH